MTLRYDSGAGTAELTGVEAATGASHPGRNSRRSHAARRAGTAAGISLRGRNFPSGIAISPDGSDLLLANRGADTIAVFGIDAGTGVARLRDEVDCGGRFPRAIRLDRTGRTLAVANQKSGNVVLFERDVESGQLAAMPHGDVELRSAMDVIFLDQ